jgi:hypothetical protein
MKIKKTYTNEELERLSIVQGNPLVDGSVLRGSAKKDLSAEAVRIGDGEDSLDIGGAVLFEGEEYAKLFTNSSNRKMLAKLSPRGVHLMVWLIQKVIRKSDLVHIDRHKYMKDSGVSRQETYMNAITDLVMAKILYRYPLYSDLYFINPHVFFKGNRLLKYKDLLKAENIRGAKRLGDKL